MNITDNHRLLSLSAATNEPLDPFYTFLSTSGFVPLLALLIGIRVLIASIGIVLNLWLVLVTILNRNLHGSTNILIAVDSFSLAIYELGFFPMWFIVLVGKNLIRLDQCFWPMLLPVFAKNLSSALMVAIGLDRLKFVIFPRVSPHLKMYFVILWTVLSASFGGVVIFTSYRIVLRIPKRLVMCAASEVTQHEAAFVSYYSTLVLNFVSPAVYCVLALFLYLSRRQKNHRHQPRQGSSASTSLYRSIFVLMLVQLCGWASNSLSLLFFRELFSIASLSDMAKWAINCVFSYVLIIASAANGPTLYLCSWEYKKAFQAQFGRLFRHMGGNSKNTPMVVKVQQISPVNSNKVHTVQTVQRVH